MAEGASCVRQAMRIRGMGVLDELGNQTKQVSATGGCVHKAIWRQYGTARGPHDKIAGIERIWLPVDL